MTKSSNGPAGTGRRLAIEATFMRIGARFGSPATAGEGTQNLLCAYLAIAVFAGLAAGRAIVRLRILARHVLLRPP